MEKVGVSDTVVKNVRRKYNLKHLGYKHLVGCNKKTIAIETSSSRK